MPIVRKLIGFGKTSRGVILPKTWLEYYEKETGRVIREVAIEVNKELRILPIIERGSSENKHSSSERENSLTE